MTRSEQMLLRRVLGDIEDRIDAQPNRLGTALSCDYVMGRQDGLSIASFIVRRIMDGG
jgi:hypothetical protein